MRGVDADRLRRIAELLGKVPVVHPGYDEERRDLVREIAGYIAPRLEEPDAPVVVAFVGGSGVGKSRLVNALTKRQHSPESSLRPTTRAPLIVAAGSQHHEEWLRRLRAAAPGARSVSDESAVTVDTILVDLPADLSDAATRRMLALADLVIVVASPTRYADSDTWALVARRRDAAQPVWVVVNRATGPDDEVGADLKRRLAAAGHRVPVFLLPEGDDGSFVDVLRARLVDASGPGRTQLLERALRDRTEQAMQRTAELAPFLDELRVRGERLKRLADAEYSTAATALSELIIESGLGPGAAAAPWPDVAERLAGVVTRRVGVAAERTASVWHTLDDGNALLSGDGHQLWRHPPHTAHHAHARLLHWEHDVARIVHRRSRRDLKPKPLGQVVAVVKSLALGGDPKVKWRVRRRLREGIPPAATEARTRLAELAASIVTDDEERFLDRMGARPSAEAVAELRDLAVTTNANIRSGLRVVPDLPEDENVEEVALDA